MQLPTVMSETLPVPVSLIGVELVRSTVTSPLEVLSTRVDPLRLTTLPSVRLPSRNPPNRFDEPMDVVPQAAIRSPSPPRAASLTPRARTRVPSVSRSAVPICVTSNSVTTPGTSTGGPELGGGAGRETRPAPPGREVGGR